MINTFTNSIQNGWETLKSFVVTKTKPNELNALSEEAYLLREALAIKTGGTFSKYIDKAQNQLGLDRQEAANRLLELNGAYYKDPLSLLKRAWDAAVKAIEELFGSVVIQTRKDLEEKHNNFQSSNRIKEAQLIEAYFNLETERNTCRETLKETIGTQAKSSVTILAQKKQELCGAFYGDSNGQLDKAWKKYTAALGTSDPNAEKLLKAYEGLEKKRKVIDIELSILEEQTNPSSDFSKRSVEVLAEDAIRERLKEIEKKICPIHPIISMHPGLGDNF